MATTLPPGTPATGAPDGPFLLIGTNPRWSAPTEALVAQVVRDALLAYERPSSSDLKCRALIATNAFHAGIERVDGAGERLQADGEPGSWTMILAEQLVAVVVRNALRGRKRPRGHDVRCKALIAADAFLAGFEQFGRTGEQLPTDGNPDEPDSRSVALIQELATHVIQDAQSGHERPSPSDLQRRAPIAIIAFFAGINLFGRTGERLQADGEPGSMTRARAEEFVASVVRGALQGRKCPPVQDVRCKALIAADAFLAGFEQFARPGERPPADEPRSQASAQAEKLVAAVTRNVLRECTHPSDFDVTSMLARQAASALRASFLPGTRASCAPGVVA